MDFNDIQSAWDNDNNENVVLPNLEKIQTANTPLIRLKNLKNELSNLNSIVVRICTLMHGSCKVDYSLYFLSMFAAVSIYYLIRLFCFEIK
jgi:hypothetical protein